MKEFGVVGEQKTTSRSFYQWAEAEAEAVACRCDGVEIPGQGKVLGPANPTQENAPHLEEPKTGSCKPAPKRMHHQQLAIIASNRSPNSRNAFTVFEPEAFKVSQDEDHQNTRLKNTRTAIVLTTR
ncbi:hypothetical protein HYALB_00009280 [Hymenoscyphus albidus]|uniref:Uncharacterized protein n=1 Tax=Hymenoscyphus albidus TaxID=595503 RepID=A0A9N9LNG2_9HELO|nr:hypothetical protein HYALB_00009280 [Hymenoscyphus albidus]